MSHRNPWYILTLEELKEMRSHLQLIEEKGSPECQKSARAVLDLLALIGGRLL